MEKTKSEKNLKKDSLQKCLRCIFSIRSQNFISLSFLFFVIFLILSGITLGFFLITFGQLEQLRTDDNSKKINRILYDLGRNNANFILQFNAAFTESFDFFIDPTLNSSKLQGYINSNWEVKFLRRFGVFLVAYYDNNGKLRDGGARTNVYPSDLIDIVPIPTQLLTNPFLKKADFSNPSTREAGFLYYSKINTTLFLISVPIQRTDFTGTGAGTVLIGLPINQINELTGVSVSQALADRSQSCVTFFNTITQNDILKKFGVVNFNNPIAIDLLSTSWQTTNAYRQYITPPNEDVATITKDRSKFINKKECYYTDLPANVTNDFRITGLNMYKDIEG
jgi:hypothetical protein